MLPGAAIDDSPIRPGELRSAKNWNPSNSDGTNRGIQRAEEGLIQSRNTMSVRIGDYAGIEPVRKLAADAGIAKVPENPAIYLGAFESSLKDITHAYTIFPNNGTLNQSAVIERIDDSEGQVVYQAAHITTPALDPGVSWMISSTLEKVLQRGTAAAARSLGFTKPAAGKTGTTNEYRDAWFVGYTRALTCGVWVGFDTPTTIIPKGYGAALALPIWTQVMNAAPGPRYPAPALASSVPLQHVRVCSVTNQLATTGCEDARTAYDIDLPPSMIPKAYCSVHPGGAVGSPGSTPEQPSVPNRILESFRHFFGH
jgi:penicillin-binding protein 1A